MEIVLPRIIGYGRLDTILRVLARIRTEKEKHIHLNWSRVDTIAPSGFAMLACIFDTAIEHRKSLRHVSVRKQFKQIPVVQNLLNISNQSKLPSPSIHNQELSDSILVGQESSINIDFIERLQMKFGNTLSDEKVFSCRLILNELMQNAADHSLAERYYLYGGLWQVERKREIHLGVLDMGITIPAKLEQKYDCGSDLDYLELALTLGVTTRRQRPGGMGLHLTLEHLKSGGGTLTLLSRDGQIIRYFKSKRVVRQKLKDRLHGTWCLVRFPVL